MRVGCSPDRTENGPIGPIGPSPAGPETDRTGPPPLKGVVWTGPGAHSILVYSPMLAGGAL